MFDTWQDRPVVVRTPSGRRRGERVLWQAGLRMAVAREHSWWSASCQHDVWAPEPEYAGEDTYGGLVARMYLPTLIAFVGVGELVSWPVGGILAVLCAVAATIVLIAGQRRFRRYQRVLPTSATSNDNTQLLRAGQAADQILRTWPRLGDLGAGQHPRPVLEAALWDLAGVIETRARVRVTRDRLARFGRRLARDHPLRSRLSTRLTRAEQDLLRLDEEVACRLDRLTTLADRCRQFAADQDTRTAARTLLYEADEVLDTGTHPTGSADDPVTGLAERTTAILDAYRELSTQPDAQQV